MENLVYWKKSFRDKKIVIALAVVLCLTVAGYAMTVSGFNDYSPPDYLYIHWYDYMKENLDDGNSTDGEATVNNATSKFPRWSVEYPYRAIFLGGTPSKVIEYFVVYSKEPSTDLFTFEYYSGDKSTYQLGRIRASIPSGKVGVDKDFRIVRVGHDNSGTFTNISGASDVNFSANTASTGISGGNAYIMFDFYYDCASEHQQNAYDLNISGVTSISGVPYKYTTHCLNHAGSSGGGSSGGSGGLSGDKNTGGSGGKHGWGTGDYGGGVNQNDIVSGNDGGGYTSRPEMDVSFPDYWKTPHEDNYTDMPTSEWQPNYNEYPEYVTGDGDTGETGENWDLPNFSDDDGVSGEISGYKELVPNGEAHLIDFMSPMEEWVK